MDIDEILFKYGIKGSAEKYYAKQAIKEIVEGVIDMCAENLGFVEITPEKLNESEYKPFITADDGVIFTVDKESILQVKNKIKY